MFWPIWMPAMLLIQISLEIQQVETQEINIGSCRENPCKVGVRCVSNPHGRRRCTCSKGYRYDEDTGCQDIDECKMDYCGKNANCTNLEGNFLCQCWEGFEEKPEGCGDIDECALKICRDMECHNLPGAYRCDCNQGMEFNLTSRDCEDIDECLVVICGKNENCVNNPGSYICSCREGFQTVEDSCEDINECGYDLADCDGINGKCINTVGSYRCKCSHGYENFEGAYKCRDTDECLTVVCEVCNNSIGSFECICKTGWKLFNDSCVDIDECECNPCQEKYACHNSDGSYKCHCLPGLVLNEKTESCDDIDECENASTCYDNSTCFNVFASYFCNCTAGYEYHAGNQTCSDVDECLDRTNRICPGEQQCINSPGSHNCQDCPSETVLNHNTNECQEPDPCNPNPCKNPAICAIKENKFVCSCPEGYEIMKETECQDKTAKMESGNARVRASSTICIAVTSVLMMSFLQLLRVRRLNLQGFIW